jgi:hypothetical protein
MPPGHEPGLKMRAVRRDPTGVTGLGSVTLFPPGTRTIVPVREGYGAAVECQVRGATVVQSRTGQWDCQARGTGRMGYTPTTIGVRGSSDSS